MTPRKRGGLGKRGGPVMGHVCGGVWRCSCVRVRVCETGSSESVGGCLSLHDRGTRGGWHKGAEPEGPL